MELLEQLANYLLNYIQLAFTILFIFLFFIGKSVARRVIRKHAFKHDLAGNRVLGTVKFINVLLGVLILLLIAITWDIDFQGLSVYMASVFAIVGVALFAQWSIISNVTASVILFFYYTYKMGSKVKVIDGDNSVTGKIVDITLFYIRIELDDGNVVSYPNNLAIQKPILLYQNDESTTDQLNAT